MTSAAASSQSGGRTARGKIMGRPTIPILGEVLESEPAKIDREAGIVTLAVRIVEGPTHVNGRIAQVEVPVPVFTKVTNRAVAMEQLDESSETIELDGSLEGMLIHVYSDTSTGREQFHVHSESCPGNKGYGDQVPWPGRAQSKADIVQLVWNPKAFHYDHTDPKMIEMYGEDILMHSCLKSLDIADRK